MDIDHILSNFSLVMPMGAPVHLHLAEELKQRFPSFEYLKTLYGLTEVMLVSSYLDPSALGDLEPGEFQKTP
jgi:hypothetical protein